MNETENQVERIFNQAAELQDATEREKFLKTACRDNVQLRSEVEKLLQHDAQVGSFLDLPDEGYAATMESPPIAERPGNQVGPYKLLQEIGEGGMGVVYMAEQREPVRRKVAFKIIKPGMDTREVVARFEAERQALAMMDHPNIATVLDAGATESGRPYFVMELVHGVPITDYCDDNDLTTSERLPLFITVCHAIQHAHQKGIIHRDISAKNVMVTLHDGVPVPKVIDFGIAKAVHQELTTRTVFTSYGQVVGTPMYMSPEQVEISDLGVDTRSDIYSLGVLLYELLTGTTPFQADQLKKAGLDELRRLIREQEPARPSTRISTMGKAATTVSEHRKTDPARLAETLRRELDWIVMKALEKDRSRRYQTANGLAKDVERYLHDEPVEACSPSKTYRVRKFARRHRVAVWTTTAVALALILGAGIAAGQAFRATKAERFANEQLEIAKEQRRLAKQQERLAKDQKKLAEEAAERERELRLEAEQARQHSDAVTAFLVEAFRSPNSERDGRKVTVAELLDQATAQLERDLSDDSDLKPRLLNALGSTYWGLGLREEAIKLHEKAYSIQEKIDETSPAEKVGAFNWLAFMHSQVGNMDAASQYANEASRIHRALLPSEHPYSLRAMEVRADVLSKMGRHDEAVPLGEEVLAVRQQSCDPHDADLLTTMANLASLYKETGRTNDAIRVLADAICRSSVIRVGDLTLHNNLGHYYYAAGRYQDAAELLEEFVPMMRNVGGDQHPITLGAMRALGLTMARLDRVDEGIELIQQALDASKEAFGAEHEITAAAMHDLAYCLVKTGKHEQAIESLDKVVKLRTKLLGAEDANTLSSMWVLASAHRQRGDLSEAKKLYEHAIPLRRKTLGATHPLMLGCRNTLGELYVELEEYTKAEPLLKSAYRGFKERLDSSPTPFDYQQCRKAIEQLMKLNALQDRQDVAASWEVKLTELQPPSEEDTFDLYRGIALFRGGEYDKGLAEFDKAIRINPGDAEAHFQRGTALRNMGRYEEAITAYRESVRLRPNCWHAFFKIGVTLADSGNHRDAIVEYRRALGISDSAEVRNDLGVALVLSGRRDEALVEFRQAVERNPENARFLSNLSELLATSADVGIRDPAEAIELARGAIALEPNASRHHKRLGVALYSAGRWQAAVEALTDSISLSQGGDGNAWIFLAMACWHSGDTKQAKSWYDKATKWRESYDPEPGDNLDVWQEAARVLDDSAAGDPVRDESSEKKEH